MTDYYATTQISVNTADEGRPRKIEYLPPYKAAGQDEWEEALGEDQFEAFVKEGVLVEVTEDTKVDEQGFIHFKRIGFGSSVVDDPNAPPDEDVAKQLTDEDVETAKAQRGEGTGQPPGLGTEAKTDDGKSATESGTVVSNDAASVRAEETEAKGGPAAKPAVNEAAKPVAAQEPGSQGSSGKAAGKASPQAKK